MVIEWVLKFPAVTAYELSPYSLTADGMTIASWLGVELAESVAGEFLDYEGDCARCGSSDDCGSASWAGGVCRCDMTLGTRYFVIVSSMAGGEIHFGRVGDLADSSVAGER